MRLSHFPVYFVKVLDTAHLREIAPISFFRTEIKLLAALDYDAYTAQKMKKSLMQNFIFCAVLLTHFSTMFYFYTH